MTLQKWELVGMLLKSYIGLLVTLLRFVSDWLGDSSRLLGDIGFYINESTVELFYYIFIMVFLESCTITSVSYFTSIVLLSSSLDNYG